MKKEVIWNSFLAALITAVFAIVGWLSLSVIKLQNQYAAETAEKRLRQDITDVLSDVDKRLAVIEAVMIIRGGEPIPATVSQIVPTPPPPSLDPDPEPSDDLFDEPDTAVMADIPMAPAPPPIQRYDLRSQRIQER